MGGGRIGFGHVYLLCGPQAGGVADRIASARRGRRALGGGRVGDGARFKRMEAFSNWEPKRSCTRPNKLPVVIVTGRGSAGRAKCRTSRTIRSRRRISDVPLLLQTVRELIDEPMENRARRASNRASSLRYGPATTRYFAKCCSNASPLPTRCPNRRTHPEL